MKFHLTIFFTFNDILREKLQNYYTYAFYIYFNSFEINNRTTEWDTFSKR